MGRIVGLEIFDDDVLTRENMAKIETGKIETGKIETGENAAITGEAISDAVAVDVPDETKEDKKGIK